MKQIRKLAKFKSAQKLNAFVSVNSTWCGREDLNLHELPHYHLKVARLPIPPRPRGITLVYYGI